MAREARVLRALDGTSVPRPQLVAWSADTDVMGTRFHLTERLDGWVVRDALPEPFTRPDAAPRVGETFMEALGALHGVDWQAAGLGDFGKPAGFLERQVTRWTRQLESYRQRPLPDLDAVGAWLTAHRPPDAPPALIHGDYHLDNVMFAPSLPPRVIAILDWETATIGDPLIDVGLSTALWPDASDGDLPFGQSLSRATLGATRLGTRADLGSHYARVTGRSIERLPYYQALGLFKLAAILEGSWARHVHGAADDPFFAHLEEGVPAMARHARTLCGA
jgi:aminoglycoside phosphotransferase (APT) family kinase protein